MAQDNSRNNRLHSRTLYNETVLINDSLKVLCNDISTGGLFVHANRALQPGSMVRITFPDNAFKVMAMVQSAGEVGGVGLAFTDLNPVQARKIEELIEQAKAVNEQRESQQKILIIEDSETVRAQNKNIFSLEGFNVLEGADGVDALKILSSITPEAVVLDLQMKTMDGYKVLAYLKSKPHLKDIPVVVFSARFTNEDRMKVKLGGADEFLQKMTTPPDKLVSIIKELIAKRAAQKQSQDE